MKKTFYILLVLLIKISLLFGQENKKRTYEISVLNLPQKIELIEYENGQYSGNVITEVSKGKYRTGWLSRAWRNIWNIKNKEIIDKNPIDEKIVKELMAALKENNIETIKNCNEDEECSKYGFLDSGSILFNIKSKKIEREYWFQEIYPLKENNKEKDELRFKAQKLLTIIYDHIDLKREFSEMFKRLPRGYYNWYKASGHSFITITNRKRKNN